MRISFEENNSGVFSVERCFNSSCVHNNDTSSHSVDNNCQQTVNTGKCKNFQCEKSEKPQIKYEIVKPFSIIDIYEKKPCSGEYTSLLKENGGRDIDARWNEFRFIKRSKVLMRNLEWLKEKGFVVEKKEKWVNVYINKDDKPYVGTFDFTSKELAIADAPEDDDTRYVGAVLKTS